MVGGIRFSRRSTWFALALASIATLGKTTVAMEPADFLTAYRQAGKRLESAYSRVAIEGKYWLGLNQTSYEETKRKSLANEYGVEFSRLGDLMRRCDVLRAQSPPVVTLAMVVDPGLGSFVVQRMKPTEPFQITSKDPGPEPTIAVRMRSSFIGGFAPFQPWYEPLHTYFARSDVTISEVVESVENGRKLVTVRSVEREKNGGGRKSNVVFLPELDWVVVRAELILHPTMVQRTSCEYEGRVNDVPAILRAEQWLDHETPKLREQIWGFERSKIETCTLTAKDFAPEAFGLPEFRIPPPTSGPKWFLWGGLCMAIAVALTFVARWGARTTRDSQRARGFTITELLVVVAILGVLLALLLPAVSAAREASRRIHCAARLRQIGQGLHAYAEAVGCLPLGVTLAGPDGWLGASAFVRLLPYIGEANWWDAFNSERGMLDACHTTLHRTVIATYACPSDSGAGKPVPQQLGSLLPDVPDPAYGVPWEFVRASYVFCKHRHFVEDLGSSPAVGSFQGRPVKLADVVDGLSKTMFASERALGEDKTRDSEKVGVWFDYWVSRTRYTASLPPNATIGKLPMPFVHFALSVRAYHAGGANVLLGDGGVRFVSDSVDSWPIDRSALWPNFETGPNGEKIVTEGGVWQRLATRHAFDGPNTGDF